MKYFILVLSLFVSLSLFAQNAEPAKETSESDSTKEEVKKEEPKKDGTVDWKSADFLFKAKLEIVEKKDILNMTHITAKLTPLSFYRKKTDFPAEKIIYFFIQPSDLSGNYLKTSPESGEYAITLHEQMFQDIDKENKLLTYLLNKHSDSIQKWAP